MTETRRDRFGRYMVVPPTGGKPIGYTRATTVAKALDDGGGLIPWKATMTVTGMLRRPGLHARWQALMAEHPDPWYGSIESKNRCKKLVEESAEAGGSTDRADMGTALHAIIEQRSIGAPGTPILQPGMQADIDAFATSTSALVFDRSLIEAVVVLDRYQVAGTADQLSTLVPDLGRCVSDLKTGADLKYSWQAIAIQLAIYANANAVYVQGEAADGSQDQRLPMPELSKELGLVIHLPAGEARCDLWTVDLVAGWEAFEKSMWTRGWRTRKDLAKLVSAGPVSAPDPAPEPAPAEPPPFDEPAVAAESVPVPKSVSVEPPPFDEVGGGESATPPNDSVVSDREASPVAALPLTPAEQHAQLAQHPDEGDEADLAAFKVLEQHYSELPPGARSWVTELAKTAAHHAVSFHAKEAKTTRRFEIIRALVVLSLAESCDDETLRAVLASVVGDVAWFPNVQTGHLVGSLTAPEAAIFARRVDELATTSVPASVDDSGRVTLHFSDLAASAA